MAHIKVTGSEFWSEFIESMESDDESVEKKGEK